MPNSFRVKLSKLRHKGSITNEDYQELKQKLDGHDARLRAEVIDEFVENLIGEIEAYASAGHNLDVIRWARNYAEQLKEQKE